jgi:tungstate transport system ATP-binding protein
VVAYHGHRVVDVGHLALAPGETLALLGPNGSGKSTLLRVLGLLERPTSGRVETHGEPVRYAGGHLLAVRRRMATVFQAPLLCDTTVASNVGLGLRFRRVPEPEVVRRVETWLDRLGIGHLAARSARTLSGGEAQRASLARAFVLEPEILFLDEPFAGLDHHGREALALELEAILRSSGITAVLVTHDRHEAALLAKRTAVMLEGRIAQVGETAQVMAQPAEERIASFLGVENLLAGTSAERNGTVGIEVAGHFLPVRTAPAPGVRVTFALRAEDVLILPPGVVIDDTQATYRAVVRNIAPAEAGFRVLVDAGFSLTARVDKRLMEAVRPRVGESVVVSFDPAAAHVIKTAGSR